MKKFVAIVFVWAVMTQSVLRAVEPTLMDQMRFVIGEEALPQMVRLPFFGHLFETSSCACNPCFCRPACHCAEGAEFGVDFDVASGPQQMIIVKRFDVQTGPCEGVCAASHCAESACCAAKQAAATSACTGECCELELKTAKGSAGGCQCQHAQFEKLIELAADRAGLAAALEAQEAIHEAKDEMFETLAGLLMEKAKLEAKLAMQGERDELTKRAHEVALENARLKVQVEQVAHLTLENDKLKNRIADLERRGTTGEDAPRTAKRTSASRKAR